jgi:plasmid replication initiation protein
MRRARQSRFACSLLTPKKLGDYKMDQWETHQEFIKKLDEEKIENSLEAKEGKELARKQIEITRYRNERNLMLYPFCSTSKRKRLKTIEYRSSDGKRWLQVTANYKFGMVKIWDFDILRFALSKAGEIRYKTGYFPSFVEFSPHECLKAIGRNPKSGSCYAWFEEALTRLISTTYQGNIFGDDTNPVEGFTLISYKYEKRDGRIQKIKIIFNERILESVKEKGLLAIDTNVINEESGVKKRLLELVKVSKGDANEWVVGLQRLKELCAFEGELKKFKRQIKSYDLPWKSEFSKAMNGRENIRFV